VKNDIALIRKYLKHDLTEVLIRFSFIIFLEKSDQAPEGAEDPVSTG